MPPKICNHCGYFNSTTIRYCKRCGQEISNANDSNHTQQFQKVKKALADKYIITEEIGKGGMAVVYKAVQKNLDRIVAVKVIKEELLNDGDAIKRFHEEARIAGSLSHKNIITIYDNGELSGIHYMTMEYLTGHDLHTIISKRLINGEKQFRDLFIQLADALEYLGKLNLIHKDIKSSNIFITETGRPVLMDFGISSLKSKVVSDDSSILGTPEYMSPEQINGILPDERSDLYSLGVVMYECLSGKVPFKGDTYSDTLHLVQTTTPVAPHLVNPKVSRVISKIIMQLISKQPEMRFQTAEDLKFALLEKNTRPEKLNTLLLTLIISIFVIFIVSIYFVISPGQADHQTTPRVNNTPVKEIIRTEEPSPKSITNIDLPVTNSSVGQRSNSRPAKGSDASQSNNTSQASYQASIDEGNALLEDGLRNSSIEKINQACEKFKTANSINQEDNFSRILIQYCDSLASTMPPK